MRTLSAVTPNGLRRVCLCVSRKGMACALSAALLIATGPAWRSEAGQAQPAASPANTDSQKAEFSKRESEPAKPDADPAKLEPAKTDAAGSTWKDKQIPDWTEADAKQLLADSPWTKTLTPAVDKPAETKKSDTSKPSRFKLGGFGLGRRNTSDASSSGSSASTAPPPDANSSSSSPAPASSDQPPTLKLRWASALPVREAELKSRDTGAPAVDEAHYAIAVYGVPNKVVKDDSERTANQLKADAAIKREAKEDIRPSGVQIFLHDDGAMILYLFPRTEEITWRDHVLEFDAQIGHLKLKQTFASDDMRFRGTLEL